MNTLRCKHDGMVAQIILDRPEKRNAISPQMATELADLLQQLEVDASVRVVALRGSGGNFCSGGDLTPEPADGARADQNGSPTAMMLDMMNRIYGETMRRLHDFPKPTVALVEGVAAGAGANLALACDLVYATPDARFCEIFVKRGLGLDCGGSWLLPRLVGLQKAKELAFFGEWVSAEEAARIGLVSQVYSADDFEAGTSERLATLAKRAPIALAQIKQSLHRATHLSMHQALELEATVQAVCVASDDSTEGMRAFLERREPDFKGR